MNEEQFRYMRLLRKEINALKEKLIDFEFDINEVEPSNALNDAKEALCTAIDALNSIEEGDWL